MIIRDKLEQTLKSGKYTKRIDSDHVVGYHRREGWDDYIIADRVIFSHRKNTYEPGDFPDFLHSHNFYEVVIYVSGDMQYIADNQYYSAKSGAVILTKPNAVHMVRLLTSSLCDRYVFYFSKDLGINIGGGENCIFDFAEFPGENCTNYLYFTGEKKERLLGKIAEFEHLLEKPTKYTEIQALTYITELFIMFSNTHSDFEFHREDFLSPAPKFIYEIKKYIDENCVNVRSVTELADRFFYNREYVSRAFKEYFNTSIYDYIIYRKLLLCRTYINEGMPIEEAAHNSGFNNISSFIRHFKRSTGMTPSEYRKRFVGK